MVLIPAADCVKVYKDPSEQLAHCSAEVDANGVVWEDEKH